MSQIAQRCVLFADLRGSTALFESLGNAEASTVVTHCVSALARTVPVCTGRVVKTLGDGLMAVFESAIQGARAAGLMQDVLDQLVQRGGEPGGSASLRGMRLQIGLAYGEVVAIAHDCYGDAVNVAARLLDHAGDSETLVTGEVLAQLNSVEQERFRSLDRIVLRGRLEPVQVHVRGGKRSGDTAATQFGQTPPVVDPDGIRLNWCGFERMLAIAQMPAVLGRSPQAAFRVDDARASRAHARLDWHGGSFQLSDLSYNGTYVRFADGEIVSLRRGSCLLHGRGAIGLGGSPAEAASALVAFEVVRLDDDPDTIPGNSLI